MDDPNERVSMDTASSVENDKATLTMKAPHPMDLREMSKAWAITLMAHSFSIIEHLKFDPLEIVMHARAAKQHLQHPQYVVVPKTEGQA